MRRFSLLNVSKVFRPFIVVFLFAFVCIGILGSDQAFASGSSFNVPQVNDHFEKVQQGPAPAKETQINPAPSKNTKPGLWDRFTATCKDALNWYKKKLYDNRKWVENLEHGAWEKAKKGDWLAGILAIILFVQVVKTSFSVGVLKGLRDTVKGIGYMILHPIKTVEGIIDAVSHPVETGKAVWKFISESFKRDVINGDASSRAEWAGYVVGSLVGAKGVDKLGKLSKLAMLSKVSKVSRAAKMGQLGRIGRGINLVQKTARKLRIPQTVSKVRDTLSGLRKLILGNKVAASVITVVSITTGLLALDPGAVVQAFNKITVAAEKFEIKTAFKSAEKCFGYQSTPKYFASVNEPFFKCFYAPDGQGVGTSDVDSLTRLDGRAVRYKTEGGAIIQEKKIAKVNNIPKYRPAININTFDQREALDYVAKIRKELGLPSLKEDDILFDKKILGAKNTVAVLESDGMQIWGRSGWGGNQKGYEEVRNEWAKGKIGKTGEIRKTAAVNAQTRTHAEGDVFWNLYKYRKENNLLGGEATLVVDRPFCKACGVRRGVQNLVEEVGLDELKVVTPSGIEIIRPRPGLKRIKW